MHLLEEALWTGVALAGIFGLVFVLALVEARMFAVVLSEPEETPVEDRFEPLRQAA